MIEIRYGYKGSKRLLNHSTFCGEAFDGHGAKFGLDICLKVGSGCVLHLQTIVWLVYKTDDYRKKQIMQGIMQYNV